jgi:tRNA(Ile)-lysidine synthase TilS/MesJ
MVCKVCILPDTVPGITLNSDGVCNLCVEEAASPDHGRAKPGEGAFLEALAPATRGSHYDVLCLYSGGKDSTYMLYVLSKKLKLRVLAMTLDNWFLSPQTQTNIKNTLQRLENVDHIYVRPSWATIRKFFQAGFTFEKGTPMGDKAYLMGHACYSCFGLIGTFAGQVAMQKKIRNIVLGATPGQMTQKSIGDLRLRYKSASDGFRGTILPLMKEMARRDDAFKPFTQLGLMKLIRVLRLRLLPLYDYVSYNEAHIYKTVEEELGWVRPRDTDSCSTNCQLNALGIHVHRNLYNISPYVIPLAHDVRTGLMTREEALLAVNAPVNPKIVTRIAHQLGLDSLVKDLVEEGDREKAAVQCVE